jgi:aspartyl-tRNA(Asn)/glutamyl-tRNA(Gln) amidotransferase subunit A
MPHKLMRISADLTELSIAELGPLLQKRKLSPVELAQAFLGRIEQWNPKLNAYLTVVAEAALAEARRAEHEIHHRRYRGPLHGIPLSLKDNIWTRRVRTTAGSKILTDFVPSEDATVVRRLRRAGAIIVGKTNLHEFAYGVTTENPHFGPTRNPWDLARIPGGSSGGSAAAIAAGLCCGSIGSDTGGSIRIPAALCGIVGLKPAFGRVSVHGVVPLSPTLDHVGPLARTVTDAAILLDAIAGRDPLDPTTMGFPRLPRLLPLRKAAHRLRLGRPREFFFERLDGEVERAVEAAARDFERLGTQIAQVPLSHLHEATEPSTHIALAEALHYHQSCGYWPARAADYGDDVRKRLEMGGDVRAVDYLRGFEVQKLVCREFAAALQSVDAILAPTTPAAAPRIGEKLLSLGGEEEPVRGALLRLNRPANLTGLPAISIPCGFTRAGLPIGLQLIGRRGDELGLLRIALLYEQAQDWHRARPRIEAAAQAVPAVP